MTRQTKRLRVLLVMFLAGLVMASGVLYIASLDYAALYPELAGLRLPIYIAVLVGLVPMIVAVKVVFDLLSASSTWARRSRSELSGSCGGSRCSSGSLPPTSCSGSWASRSPSGSPWDRRTPRSSWAGSPPRS